MPITVLGHTLGRSPYASVLARELRLEAERTRTADEGYGFLGQRVTALVDLAAYVEAYLELDDPRLLALYAIQGTFGNPDELNPAELGEYQSLVWHSLGKNNGGPLPSVEHLFEDFLYAGVLDVIGGFGKRHKEDRDRIARLEAELNSERQRADDAERELRETKNKLEATIEERDELPARLAVLEPLVPDFRDQGSEGDTFRRKHFAEDPAGVFRTKLADGSVKYELKIGDSPWQSYADRDQAIAAAEALREETALA